MLELRRVTAGYGGKAVLREVSLSFPPGKVTVLLGPNGCGKSTLLKAALGLIPILGGEVLLDGKDLSALTPREIAQKAAYLAQSRSVPNITAERMVLNGRFPYLSYPRRYRTEDYRMAEQALALAGAEDLAGRPMPELSGGQRQKVYLAMALAQDTGTLLLDEPTTYLDVRHQLELLAAARRLAQEGRAVGLVLHDLGAALRCADCAAVLADGAVCCAGTPEEVYRSGVLDRVFGVAVKRVLTEDGWQYYAR